MATGYDNDFLDSTEDYECPLCLHVTRDPTLTSCCGQHFCQTCINRILIENKPCPCCKEARFNVFLDKKQKRRVLELKVNCSMKARGCVWIGELSKLEAHLDIKDGTCGCVDITCPKLCGNVMQKKRLVRHLRAICPNRDYKCKHCGYEATFEAVEKHYKECPKYPLPCPNNCGVGLLERQKLKPHIEECPLQEVICEFGKIGCATKIQRKDLAKHLECNLQAHLSLVTEHSLKTTQQLLEAQRDIKSLKERVSSIEVSSMLPPVELKLYQHSVQDKELILYTHHQGYKLNLRLTGYHTHNRSGSIRHTFTMTVSHVQCEHDDKLEWPSSWTIEITAFNHAQGNTNYVISEDFELQKDGKNIKEVNVMLEEMSKKNEYINNESIQLKIDIKSASSNRSLWFDWFFQKMAKKM